MQPDAAALWGCAASQLVPGEVTALGVKPIAVGEQGHLLLDLELCELGGQAGEWRRRFRQLHGNTRAQLSVCSRFL